jgi:hypothetical protein
MSLTINLAGDVIGTNNGNVVVSINGPSPITIGTPTLQWNNGIASPIITQSSTTTAGQNLTIQAQSTTGSSSTAGNLNLAAGTAPTAAGTGDVNIQGGAPNSLVNIVTFNATDFDNDGLVETMGIGSSLVSPRIYQITGSGAGNSLTIQAQNAAGSNNSGGSLFLKGGTATGTGTAGGIVPTVQVRTNTSNSTYTIDSTGGGSDYHILHNNTNGSVSYVMPAPTAGREIFLRDITGAINTYGAIPSSVFLVPHAAEKFNTSSGYVMSGTFHVINGSTAVTASTTQSGILSAGMSIVFGTDTKSYIVSAFNGTTGITLASTYTGTTNATATGTINSLTFAANYGVLRLVSDGTNWYARGDGTPTYVAYSANGTFITPQGVTFLDVSAFGGGGGGGSGGSGTTSNAEGGGGGGGGSIQSSVAFAVIPSTSNSITIGAGGTGGTAVTSSLGNNGNPGGDTIIQNINYVATFLGASGGMGGTDLVGSIAGGGLCVRNSNTSGSFFTTVNTTATTTATTGIGFLASIGSGGAALAATAGNPGSSNPQYNNTTSSGGTASSGGGGGGGGSGPNGPGGNGGNGSTSTPTAGASALANTGGGGGGGGGIQASAASAAGGNGGSGFLSFTYSL